MENQLKRGLPWQPLNSRHDIGKLNQPNFYARRLITLYGSVLVAPMYGLHPSWESFQWKIQKSDFSWIFWTLNTAKNTPVWLGIFISNYKLVVRTLPACWACRILILEICNKVLRGQHWGLLRSFHKSFISRLGSWIAALLHVASSKQESIYQFAHQGWIAARTA